ncbi:MAG TPA: alanine--tRNA ligase, partial [Gammaproteobacteria bacterium]|nr:alanine--tRNA ligase [Gammaproteobacteria bacterium]
LPKPSVDTGMGLERLAAVLQGVHSNYDTDLFTGLIKRAAEITGARDMSDKSLRVIADHIRSCAFLIVDGVMPSNEGRGYVLRRIIRRAIRHGHKLGVSEPFFFKLVASLESQIGKAYPELGERRPMVERILRQEEERFSETLDQGLGILEEAIEDLSGNEIPGETVFMLYDTFGFPVDLTADIARERGLSVDMKGFEQSMEGQRRRARAASQFEASGDKGLELKGASEFVGYEHLIKESSVTALFCDGEPVDRLGPEDRGMAVLESTPFYSEGGGQVGDRGELSASGARFEVEDTQRRGEAVVHYGVMTDGEIRVGDKLLAKVDMQRRRAIARNHSATHLLHAALRKVLGTHVTQKGSLVAPDRLRFDFSHFEPVSKAQLRQIEDLVNQWVLQNDEAVTRVMPLDKARESGAIALFGEKYDDPVRVLSFGEYSTELCGGTHVAKTGDVGLFKLTSETGVAAGVRRVEAVTGEGALQWVRDLEDRLGGVAAMLKSDRDGVVEKTGQLLQRNRELERELEKMKARLVASHGDDLAAQAEDVDGLKVLAAKLEGVDPKRLRETVDRLKSKLGSAAIVLATVQGDKVSLVAGVTPDYVDRIAAGPLANFVAQQVGGRGGGRPDMAQAGGNDPSKIDQAIRSVPNWIRERLSA